MEEFFSPELESFSEREEFTFERLKQESRLVKKAQKAIRESKSFSEEEKIKGIRNWDEYFKVYLHEYNRYHRIQLERMIYQSLTILN